MCERTVPNYKLGDWLSVYDNILDNVTFIQLITAVRCNCKIKNAEAVRREAQQILSPLMQDYWYLIENNMEEIIEAATPEEAKPLKNHPNWNSERLEALAYDIYQWLILHNMWIDVHIYYDGKRMGTSGIVDGQEVFRYNGEPFIQEEDDPRKYFDRVATKHILSMSFEGTLYEALNGYRPGWEKLEAEFDRIFEKHGCYLELGDAWNATCYELGE